MLLPHFAFEFGGALDARLGFHRRFEVLAQLHEQRVAQLGGHILLACQPAEQVGILHIDDLLVLLELLRAKRLQIFTRLRTNDHVVCHTEATQKS